MNNFDLKTCRTCLIENGAEVPLFILNYGSVYPSEMLSYCTSLEIQENDGYPAYVCENCNYKLTVAYDFCKLAKSSHSKLSEYMKPPESVISIEAIETLLDMGSEKEIDATSQYPYQEELLQTPVKGTAPNEQQSAQYSSDKQPKRLTRNSKKVKPIKSRLQLDSLLAKHQKKLKTEKSSTVKIFKQQRKSRVKTMSGNKGETCPVCLKTFQYKGYLESHLRTHSQEKPFSCNVCGKKFISTSNLAMHLKSHSNNRTHQCEICSKLFISNSNLMAHKRTHSDVRNFQCLECDLAFKTQKDLKLHAVVHTEVKSHNCDRCSKKFHKRAYLNSHMRVVHVGEKRYSCKECGKQFSSSSNLTCHFRIHSGVKPFVCKFPSCTAKFNQSQALRRHQRSHNKSSAEIVQPIVEIPQDVCYEPQREEPREPEITYNHQQREEPRESEVVYHQQQQMPVYHHTTNELLQHEPHYLRQPAYHTESSDMLTSSMLHQQEDTQMINILSDQSSISSSNDSNSFNFHSTIPPTIPSTVSNFDYYKIPPYQHQYSEYDIQQQYSAVHNQYTELTSFSKLTAAVTPNNTGLFNNYIGLPYQ